LILRAISSVASSGLRVIIWARRESTAWTVGAPSQSQSFRDVVSIFAPDYFGHFNNILRMFDKYT